MSTSGEHVLSVNLVFNKLISRLFIFRPLWMFVEMRVVLGRGIWIGLIQCVHFWYMLILGKRNENRRNKQRRFVRHMLKRQLYLMFMTDERPKFIED